MKLLKELANTINKHQERNGLKTLAMLKGNERFDSDILYQDYFLHWMYKNDTALHLVAASHQYQYIQKVINLGFDPNDNQNRRLASPLHYAADAVIDHPYYDEKAQQKTLKCLIKNKANLNGLDKSGMTPLLRAIRCRSFIAVLVLIKAGADIRVRNTKGSDAMKLASVNSGRGGSGSQKSKQNQIKIIKLLQSL